MLFPRITIGAIAFLLLIIISTTRLLPPHDDIISVRLRPLPNNAELKRIGPRAMQSLRPSEQLATMQPLIVIGDLHGDLQAALCALRLGGIIGMDQEHWLPGLTSVVVQLGDQIDRGDDDRAVLELFARLEEEAHAEGGEAISLIGDHEILNCQLAFSYVKPAAFGTFSLNTEAGDAQRAINKLPAHMVANKNKRFGPGLWQGRGASFSVNGSMRVMLSKRNLVHRHGSTLVVHAGLLEAVISNNNHSLMRAITSWADFEHYSDELQSWLRGERQNLPEWLEHPESMMWTRRYGVDEPTDKDCEALHKLLRMLECKRMVVGHTVQAAGISSACEGSVWRIDVGLSSSYPAGRHGRSEVLLVHQDRVQVMSS